MATALTAVAICACASRSAPPPDSAPDPDASPIACAPRATPTPSLTWAPPHPLHASTCIPQDAAAIVSCALQNQNCAVPVSAACHTCALSADTAPSSAALIVHPQQGPSLNIAGCVAALAGDPSASGCGPKLALRDACISASCAHCTDPSARPSCLTRSATTVCATAATDALCAAPYLPQCTQGSTQLDVALNLVTLFCGP